jgi:uncharacterized membrane protein YphA (DoxX/SURF4 family)
MLKGGSGGQGPVMTVLRAIARPMLASIFVIQGYDTLRNPERVAPVAEPVVRRLAERVPAVPAKTEHAVRVNGAVQLAAGSFLALGWLPRLSALAIAATLVPTTAAGHRFWEAEEEGTRAQQRIQFLKNLAMFGGLLIAGADTAGRPSLAWRTRHAARSTRTQAARTARTAKVSGKAGKLSGRLHRKLPIALYRSLCRSLRSPASGRTPGRRRPAGPELPGRRSGRRGRTPTSAPRCAPCRRTGGRSCLW